MKLIHISITVAILSFMSCYPPRIIYGVESFQPNAEKDSIQLFLEEAEILFAGTFRPLLGIALEIQNEKSVSLFLSLGKSHLELHSESEILQYKNRTEDTLDISFQMLPHEAKLKYKSCTISPHEKKQRRLFFDANDMDYITFNSMKEKRHKLFLSLDLKDENGNKIEKEIILVPIKVTRKY